MSQRSFEGYRYGVPLEAEFYGNAYRAYATSGAEVRLLEVGPTFTAHQEFAATFLARGKLLGNFEHLNVVRTHVVGRNEQGGLIAVTDAVPGRVRLESLLGGATATEMRPMPRPVAVSVALALLEGLAAAHDRSIVHGALHPRSVLIDSEGTVRIDDFAVGRALATWSERDSAASFVKAFGGFLAPELTQGARPDASTDVFAAAAVVLAVTTGRLSIAAVGRELPPAIIAVLARALDTNRLHRYANAKRLRDDLKATWKAEGWVQGTSDDICAFIEQRRRRAESVIEQEAELDQETEDVLSFLGDIATPPPAAPELVNAVNSMLAELDDEEPAPARPAPVSLPTNALASAVAPGAPASAAPGAPARPAASSTPARPATPGAPAELAPITAPITAPAPAPAPPHARAASANLAMSALADLDDESGSFGAISRRPNTATPLPSLIRPSSEEIAFAALDDLGGELEDATPAARLRTATPLPEALQRQSQDLAMAALADLDDEETVRPGSLSRRSEPAVSPRGETPAPRAQAPAPRAETPASRPRTATPSPARASGSIPAPAPAPAPARPSAVSVVAMPPPEGFGSDDPTLAINLGKRRSLGPVLWLLLVIAGGGALFWVVRQQSALREQSEATARATEAKQREILDQHRAAQPRSGRIVIDSEPAEAAVWMLLGRTPLQSDKLSAAMVHELRLELDGYKPQDLRVVGKHWRGEGEELHAEVAASLQPGTLATPLPAYPPEPPPEDRQGLPQGEGSIHVTSEPPGAQVWLLVGITPGVDISVTAGAEYEIELLKDGHLPGIVVVRAGDWKNAEDQTVSHSVTLQPQPKKR